MALSTLKLPLLALPPGSSRHHGRLEWTGRDAADEDEPFAVDVDYDVDHLGSRVHVRGEASGRATATCHRCLARFERSVVAPFELVLQRGAPDGESDDLVAVPESAAEYDLAPHVQEAVVLEEPIQLLCDPDCRGLCPQCGADRNRDSCSCVPAIDPRWAPLERLQGSTSSSRTGGSGHGPAEA